MFGLGLFELLLLMAVGILGLTIIGGLFVIIRAATRR